MPRQMKSDERKKLEGTYQSVRARPLVPKPIETSPIMPQHLSAKAAAVWPEICGVLLSMRCLTAADGLAVESTCEAYSDLRAAREALAAHGGARTYVTTNSQGESVVRPYPEVAMIAVADAAFRRWLSSLGLTPTDRNKLQIGSEPKEDNPYESI